LIAPSHASEKIAQLPINAVIVHLPSRETLNIESTPAAERRASAASDSTQLSLQLSTKAALNRVRCKRLFGSACRFKGYPGFYFSPGSGSGFYKPR